MQDIALEVTVTPVAEVPTTDSDYAWELYLDRVVRPMAEEDNL